MGSILASTIIAKASGLLEDLGFKVWTQADLLGYLNDGQNAIVALRPDAKTRVRAVQLSAGTRQSILPPDLRVLDVIRNMGAGGSTPGRAIRFVGKAELDLEKPNWHAATANPIVSHWTMDERTPEVWWVSPPQPSSGTYVELVTSCTPTPCTIANVNGESSSTPIDIADIYANPLLAFVLMRAHGRDNEYAQPGGKGQLAQQEFFGWFGLKMDVDKKFRAAKSNPPQYSAPPAANDGPLGDR